MTCSTSHMVKRMASKTSLKQRFLKKWIKGLQIYSSSKNLTTITQRKKFIKLSADVAMASVRDGTTKWSRALIAKASQETENKTLVEQISGHSTEISTKTTMNEGHRVNIIPCSIAKKITSKKIMKRSRRIFKKFEPNSRNRLMPVSIAKRLVKKRTEVLKNLVPGGESMDDVSLIKETLDYIVYLRAQVEMMRSLACISEHLNRK